MIHSLGIKTNYKLIVGILIGLAVIGGILAAAMKYFQAFSDMSQVADKNPIQRQAVDLARLSESYKAESAKIISDFLSASASGGSDIAALAAQAQNGLLSLTVSGESRQKHLSEVLLLGEINSMATAGDDAAGLSAKISELARIFNAD